MVSSGRCRSGVFGEEGQKTHNKVHHFLLSADLIFALSSRIYENLKELEVFFFFLKITIHKQAVYSPDLPRMPLLQMAGSRLGWADSAAFRKAFFCALPHRHSFQELPAAPGPRAWSPFRSAGPQPASQLGS